MGSLKIGMLRSGPITFLVVPLMSYPVIDMANPDCNPESNIDETNFPDWLCCLEGII